ncbi:hypothetical protein VMCG_04118 [Cytospora schulzeri]|uniref:Heterokaryon incompatibility domain-containing protein n=1 Tax=Cytospora schulzeri TaxID=448051 RepID=A0A423WUM0_9PEZI|nr:hypothetical protein VMCG_04118 [Valsa malicola]
MAGQGPSQEFIHTPLSSPRSFRVLELLPSRNFDSTVCCEIREASLDDRVSYEALSYVWGVPTPGYSVSVDTKTLAVTPNCLLALRHLRLRSKQRVLWIDAICIDQRQRSQSTPERNHQVKLMGEIYSKAQTVLVWLGASDPTTARSIRRLKLVGRTKMLSERLNLPSQRLQRRLSKPILHSSNGFTPNKYRAMFTIIRNDWWQRAWTFQEQALARQCVVLHGRRSISMSDLTEAIASASRLPPHNPHRETSDVVEELTRKPLYHRSRYEMLKQQRGTMTSQASHRTAKTVLAGAFFLDSMLPVDQIYALHSLLVACGVPLPEPDYTKTLEVVFEEAVWAWIESQQDLSIIQTAARPNHLENLPSWVPAYHLVDRDLWDNPGRSAFHAFSWSITNYQIGDNPYAGHTEAEHCPKMLRVKGRYIGKVAFRKSKVDIWRQSLPQRGHIFEQYCWYVRDRISALDPHGYNEVLRELFETLAFPLEEEHRPIPHGHDSAFSVFKAWFQGIIEVENSSQEESESQSDRDWYSTARRWTYDLCSERQHHAFCVLDNGMLGRANGWCEVGDEVFLLRGADCPFALRRDGDNYRLVGPTYVHRLYQAQPWRFDGDDVQQVTLV